MFTFIDMILDNASFWDTNFESADARCRFQTGIPEDDRLELSALPHPSAVAYSR